MLLVPGAIIALIGAHMYLVVKLGTTAPPWTKADKPRVAEPTTNLDAGVVGSNGYRPGRLDDRGRPARDRHRPRRDGDCLMKPQREAGIPRGIRDPQEEGEALLPLRGPEGLGDGADRRRRDHRDVADPRRRAGPEGRPDDDHLRAAARVVLLLPLRAPAPDQTAGAGPDRDDRHPDHLHGPAAPAAVLRPRPRAASRAPAAGDHRRDPDDPRDGLPHLLRCRLRARRPRST